MFCTVVGSEQTMAKHVAVRSLRKTIFQGITLISKPRSRLQSLAIISLYETLKHAPSKICIELPVWICSLSFFKLIHCNVLDCA